MILFDFAPFPSLITVYVMLIESVLGVVVREHDDRLNYFVDVVLFIGHGAEYARLIIRNSNRRLNDIFILFYCILLYIYMYVVYLFVFIILLFILL